MQKNEKLKNGKKYETKKINVKKKWNKIFEEKKIRKNIKKMQMNLNEINEKK